MKPLNTPAANFRLYKGDEPYLARLRPLDRLIIQAATTDGLSYETIAAAHGVPIGTVRSKLHRTRAAVLAMRAKAKATDGVDQ